MNAVCENCNELVTGRCGGMNRDPGGCWVEIEPFAATWDQETGQMVGGESETQELLQEIANNENEPRKPQ